MKRILLTALIAALFIAAAPANAMQGGFSSFWVTRPQPIVAGGSSDFAQFVLTTSETIPFQYVVYGDWLNVYVTLKDVNGDPVVFGEWIEHEHSYSITFYLGIRIHEDCVSGDYSFYVHFFSVGRIYEHNVSFTVTVVPAQEPPTYQNTYIILLGGGIAIAVVLAYVFTPGRTKKKKGNVRIIKRRRRR